MLAIGIVGLPNVGKSTLFNALTGSNALAANYPFATIEPNTGIVPVPDARLQKLAELYNTSGVVPASVTFVDIAGLVEGASHGEGLGNQFLSHIRSVSVIIQVVRSFNDPNVTRIDNGSDPKKDIGVINTELMLADLQTISRRLTKFDKEARADPKLRPLADIYKAVNDILESGEPLWNHPEIDFEAIADLHLLTAKPVIYLFNVSEDELSDQAKKDSLSTLVKPSPALFVSAKLEDELKDLDDTDAIELLSSYGQHESGLLQLIHASYDQLGLRSFLTAGEKEVRAWTIEKGSTAPEAAGVIHKDFERGFISAEIVDYKDLIAAGSMASARSNGKVRTEGKNYIMKPDDVVLFRFNV